MIDCRTANTVEELPSLILNTIHDMCKLARCESRIRSEDICKHIFAKCGISTNKERITVEGVVMEFDGRKMFSKKQSSDGKIEIQSSGGKNGIQSSGGKKRARASGNNI